MRKLITYFLLLAMICSLAGCGSNSEEPTVTEPGCTTQEMLLNQATILAQHIALAVNDDYLLANGIPADVAEKCNGFSVAADPQAAVSAALLRVDKVDLPITIPAINSAALGTSTYAAISALQYFTQFYSPLPLSGDIAILLQYGTDCSFVVLFESGEHNLIRATTYPLLPECTNMLLNKYYPNHDISRIDQEKIRTACANASQVSCKAEPIGGEISTDSYLNMAEYMLANSNPLGSETIIQYTSDPEVRSQTLQFSRAICSEPQNSAVYCFPSNLETIVNGFTSAQVKNLARQNAYLGWINQVCANYGNICLASNSILRNKLYVDIPRGIIAENETPVLIVLDFGEYAGIITLYPNEYGTYLYNITCLPCSYTEAILMLSLYGASKM